MDPTNDTPEDLDPGAEVEGGGTPEASVCTNGGAPPCNCINAAHGPDSGLHIVSITVSANSKGQWSGRWVVQRNSRLFMRSGVVDLWPNNAWQWAKGWHFNQGDRLGGGFWLTTGGWLEPPDGGPAVLTVHA